MDIKRVLIWTGITVAALAGGYFIYKAFTDKPDTSGSDSKTDNKPSGSTTVANDKFPLKLGSKGEKVRNLNTVLSLPQTDVFTEDTQRELLKRFKIIQVTSEQYNRALEGISQTGSNI